MNEKKRVTDGWMDGPTDGYTLSQRCEDASKNYLELKISGGGIDGGHVIPWDDSLLTKSLIFKFIEKA